MRFKVIREVFRNGNYSGGNFPCNTYKFDGSFSKEERCHVHLLCMNYKDHFDTSYIVDLGDEEYNDFSNLIIYDKPKKYKNCSGHWGLIASSDPSFDLPSIDTTIAELVKDKFFFDFEQSACDICFNKCYRKHLLDGINPDENDLNRGTSKYIHRPPCSWFDRILPYSKAFKEIRFFWKNNNLFVLRKYNGKIYEGYQYLNLSEEEKENMLK